MYSAANKIVLKDNRVAKARYQAPINPMYDPHLSIKPETEVNMVLKKSKYISKPSR